MSYFDTLTTQQKANIAYIIQQMKVKGITNKYTQAAILAVSSKESSFIPQEEKSYANTDNARIRKVFGERVPKDDAALDKLKADPSAFFNKVYSNRYGNGPTEGYLYRGRGFNQLTFKGNYQKIKDLIGIDIVRNPEMMNQVSVATLALLAYFMDKVKNAPTELLAHYNTTDINGFKTLLEAVKCIYHANAGWGKPISALEADPTGGRKKAIERAPVFLSMIG